MNSGGPAEPVTRRGSLDSVLSFAWSAGEFTASDAMAATGVTRSTAIDAIDALVGLDLLSELPNARDAGSYRKGRPARRFTLRADAGVVVGVDAGVGHLTVLVADLLGATLHRATASLDESDSGPARVRRISAAVGTALAAVRHRGDAVALCVGVPAPVDRFGGSPAHREGFWQRMNPDLITRLGSEASLVRIENDASLATLAEGARGDAVGCTDYITLLAGDRLGAGVVVDGTLLRGVHGGVGEMDAFVHVTGVGSADGLGYRAADLARAARATGELASSSPLAILADDEIDGRAVLELAAKGDPDALAIAEKVGTALAQIVSVLGGMFDPQRVIVSGAVSSGVGPVVEAARRMLPTGLDLPAPEIAASHLGSDVVAVGAVVAALESVREHALGLWLADAE